MGPGRVKVDGGIVRALREYLGSSGMTRRELAEKAGVGTTSVGRIQEGEKVSARTYALIAKAIGYAEADAGMAGGENGEVFARGPSGHVIHVTLTPGTSLTIRMDQNGVQASAGNGGGK